jgi:hypothetical protein
MLPVDAVTAEQMIIRPVAIPQFSAAADRNKRAILEVLLKVLPARGTALEIASGTGEHVAWFAAAMPQWTWQPTDFDEGPFGSFASIEAHVAQAGLANVRAPVRLDVTAPQWPVGEHSFDAIYCANMLHIAPWAACEGLMAGAARHLAANGVLVTYGPYLEDDVPTAPSNLQFDESLRGRDPAWGIRRLEDVKQEAARAGLVLRERHAMPANNLLLVFGRSVAG